MSNTKYELEIIFYYSEQKSIDIPPWYILFNPETKRRIMHSKVDILADEARKWGITPKEKISATDIRLIGIEDAIRTGRQIDPAQIIGNFVRFHNYLTTGRWIG